MRHVIKLVLCAGVLAGALVVPSQASAQAFSAGYQYQKFNSSYINSNDLTLPYGMNFDVAFPVAGPLSVFGQIDWGRDRSTVSNIPFTTTTLVMGGGVRIDVSMPSASPFVQALYGRQRTNTVRDRTNATDGVEADPLVQVGGGIVIPMSKFGLLAQVDYRRLMMEDADSVGGFRVIAGVRVGRR